MIAERSYVYTMALLGTKRESSRSLFRPRTTNHRSHAPQTRSVGVGGRNCSSVEVAAEAVVTTFTSISTEMQKGATDEEYDSCYRGVGVCRHATAHLFTRSNCTRASVP